MTRDKHSTWYKNNNKLEDASIFLYSYFYKTKNELFTLYFNILVKFI